MTGASTYVAAARAQSLALVELRDQLATKPNRRNTVASDQATALRTTAKLKAQIQSDGVAAVLADIPYDPPADLARQLRKATDKVAPCAAALVQLDSEIAALRSAIEAAERARTKANFSYSSEFQRVIAEEFKAGQLALLPQLAALIAVDTFRARHASGAMSGVPAGGDRPWQSTQVVVNFLKSIPAQLRPERLTLDAIQRQALQQVAIIEAELLKETTND